MTAENRIERIEAQIREASDLAAALARDPHRPAYHFTPPAAWMNDINGSLFWKGRYHIFYQYNPDGAYWNLIQWGHASSVDLVHWVHHPVALTPEADGPDRIGCFSGGALVSKEGVPTLIYYGNPDGLCLARSSDDLLIEWTKDPGNPVIPQPEEGSADFGRYTIHDPCGWLAGDLYYAAINKRDPQDQGDAAYLFKSTDLRTWSSPVCSTSRDGSGPKEAKTAPCRTFSRSTTGTCCSSAAICREPSTTSARSGTNGFIPRFTGA